MVIRKPWFDSCFRQVLTVWKCLENAYSHILIHQINNSPFRHYGQTIFLSSSTRFLFSSSLAYPHLPILYRGKFNSYFQKHEIRWTVQKCSFNSLNIGFWYGWRTIKNKNFLSYYHLFSFSFPSKTLPLSL